jgi:CubicO group peptidase (beta-lactamase class C family)
MIGIEVDPPEVGLDPARLERIDRHFQRYVDDGLLAGWLALVSRAGKVAHLSTYGLRDIDAGLPVDVDTVFRIYSMTKPITSVAAMICYEEGAFELTDPVSRFIPAFDDTRVFVGGSSLKPVTAPLTEPVRIWHLLTHTAGLSYGFHYVHPVDALYRAAGFDFGVPTGRKLGEYCDKWASLPLLFEPGTRWNYSVATDVLGHVIEVVSGKPFDVFLEERVFGPLGMRDTAFFAEREAVERLAELYTVEPTESRFRRAEVIGKRALEAPTAPSGGGGLLSTASDYHRFTQMLLGRGTLAGTRLLGPRTVDYMTVNHLPGGADLETFGHPINSESAQDGIGFGLGFAVVVDPVATRTLTSAGEYSWGGAASTTFFISPAEQLTAVFLTQLLPSNTYPIRSQFHQLVYQSIVG